MILFKSKFAGSEIYITDAYTRAYLAIAEQRGLDIHELLDHVAVEETESPDIDAFETKSDSSKDNAIYSITANEYLTLIEKIVDKSGNHGIALEVGLQIPPTAFGMVGFAMMSSATVESAMEVGTRYWHLLRDGIAINVSIEDDTCCIEFDFFQELQEKLENLVLETSMASCFRVIQLIFGEKFTSELWLKQPSPYYSELYLPMIPNLKYDQQKNQLRFPKDLLSLKIPTSSELSLSMALEKCEEENQLMSENGMIFQLERYLKKCEGKFPSLVEA
ncbi:MAG: AraC family transcriptional regulator ligand-binding domain-containing protein, partial [Oleibacter sp.]|nr:AraC family transcriptional regulator ligand-binding domain-containing protein [Thalassolituus sp.]